MSVYSMFNFYLSYFKGVLYNFLTFFCSGVVGFGFFITEGRRDFRVVKVVLLQFVSGECASMSLGWYRVIRNAWRAKFNWRRFLFEVQWNHYFLWLMSGIITVSCVLMSVKRFLFRRHIFMYMYHVSIVRGEVFLREALHFIERKENILWAPYVAVPMVRVFWIRAIVWVGRCAISRFEILPGLFEDSSIREFFVGMINAYYHAWRGWSTSSVFCSYYLRRFFF